MLDMLRLRLGRLSLADASLALVGLMWIFPFLHYRHQYPLTTFYQEWWSALLGVLALCLLCARSYWERPGIPRIVQLPVALIFVVLLQWGLGPAIYVQQVMLYVLYLLFAALLMLLGARLRDCFGIDQLALVLAACLLVGAELNAAIGVIQQYRWSTPLDAVTVMKVSSSVFGNIAQPNHFANYIALGLASLGLLYQQRRVATYGAVLLAIPLLFVMTLSGSRSSWLYLLWLVGLSAWWGWRDAKQRRLLRYSLSLLAGFGLMHLLVQLPLLTVAGSSTDTVQRLIGDEVTGGGIRLYLWREAALMFVQSPWLGSGFGQFAWQHLQLLPELRQHGVVGLYNNAHNLIFHLAAEAGVAGLLALLVPLALWWAGLHRMTMDVGYWWGIVILGVLGIHSLLEYPLWYAYFIAIAALLMGALDQTRYRLELRQAGRISVLAMMLMGVVTLVQLRSDYRQLEQAVAVRPASGSAAAPFENVKASLAEISAGSLLSPYAELFISSLIEVNAQRVGEKLALNTRVAHFAPIGLVVYRQVLLLAQSGRIEQAKILLVQALWSYPADFPGVRKQIAGLADKDPAHFSALLEFAIQKEQEYLHAVRH
ncbi:MAG: O-antigen ligase C-terminal domain-containing protein [Nitrosomonadales bacterium]|nr:O-antigen ligase C-terminal domain-containing protein [Nitrosomonadales bacterium]